MKWVWGYAQSWWQDNWEVLTYECECGAQVHFTLANLRRNGIHAEQMYHNHSEAEGAGKSNIVSRSRLVRVG